MSNHIHTSKNPAQTGGAPTHPHTHKEKALVHSSDACVRTCICFSACTALSSLSCTIRGLTLKHRSTSNSLSISCSEITETYNFLCMFVCMNTCYIKYGLILYLYVNVGNNSSPSCTIHGLTMKHRSTSNSLPIFCGEITETYTFLYMFICICICNNECELIMFVCEAM